MKILIYTVLLIVCPLQTQAQYHTLKIGTTLPSDAVCADTSAVFSFYNPASGAYIKQARMAFGFENKFFLGALSSKNLNFHLPFSIVNTAVHFQYSGYSVFHSMIYGVSLARKYKNLFSLGFQLNRYSVYQYLSNDYQSLMFWQLGSILSPRAGLNLGFYVSKTFTENVQNFNLELPSEFVIGGDFRVNSKIDLLFQSAIDTESDYRISAAFTYQLPGDQSIGTGLSLTDFLSNDLSYQIRFKVFDFSIKLILHPLLGLISTSAISYKF